MKRAHRWAAALSGCVGLLVLATSVQAVKVVNKTTSVVLFADDFEADPPGNQPAHANPGVWTSGAPTGATCAVINDAAPGAFQGQQYLEMGRILGAAGGAQANMYFVPPSNGDLLHVEAMIYIDATTAPGGMQLTLNDRAVVINGAVSGGVGNVRYLDSTVHYVDTGLQFQANTWQKWEVDYVVGSSTSTVTVDGNSVAGLSTYTSGDVPFIQFNNSNEPALYYVDASAANLPLNDACANAEVVGNGTYGGSTMSATGDGAASCGNSAGSPDVWYKIVPANSGNLLLDTCGSGFDAVLSIYSGCGGTEIACNDTCGGTPCGGTDACLSVPVTAGQTYLVRVAGANGATGGYTLHVTTPPPPGPVNDNCAEATPVTDGTYSGSTATASNDGGNDCGGTLGPDVWFAYTPTANGVLHADLCGSSYDTVLSIHSACPGSVSNELTCNDDCRTVVGGPCSSSRSCVTLNVTAGVTYLLRVGGWNGGTGDYVLHLENLIAQPPPANDDCAAATPIGNGTFTGSTTWATNDGDAPCGNSGTAADVWYAYTATCTGILSADTCGSAYNTVLSVHSACPGTAGNALACNDDCGAAGTSCLLVPVTSGHTYLIRVSGNSGATGDFTLNTSCGPAVTEPSLPLVQNFETDTVGSSAGWETAPSLTITPSTCANPQPVQVINTDHSPLNGGSQGLHWLKNADGSARSGVARRWAPPASSTTAVMKVDYDFKIVQHTVRGLSFVVSGFDASGKLNLNVYNLRFDSTTFDLPLGWNYLDNGNWNTFIPVTDVNQVIGHWFHYAAIIDVGARTVDLTITPLDAGGAGGHIVGSFQTPPGGNPLDADVANYTGLFVFQAVSDAASEVVFDNVKLEIVGQEACNTPWADFDGDGDVDQYDFGLFQACYVGTAGGMLSGCHCMDVTKDGSVDKNDFARFQQCFSGSGVTANPLCGQ